MVIVSKKRKDASRIKIVDIGSVPLKKISLVEIATEDTISRLPCEKFRGLKYGERLQIWRRVLRKISALKRMWEIYGRNNYRGFSVGKCEDDRGESTGWMKMGGSYK